MFYINDISAGKKSPTGEMEISGRSVAPVAENGSGVARLSVEEIADLMVLSTKFQEIENSRKQKEIDAKTANYQMLAQEIATLGIAGFLNNKEVERWNKKFRRAANGKAWWISHSRAAVDDGGRLYVMEEREISWWTWYLSPLCTWVGSMAVAVSQLNLDIMTAVMMTYVIFAVGAFVVMELGSKWRLVPFNYDREDDRLQGWLEETRRAALREVSEARKAVQETSNKENWADKGATETRSRSRKT